MSELFFREGKYLSPLFSNIIPGEVILVCGYPRIGKTDFGLFIQQDWCGDRTKNGMLWICSKESESDMKQRMLCAHASIDYRRYKTGHISFLEKKCYERAEQHYFQRHAVFIRNVNEPYPAMKRYFKDILDSHVLSLMIVDDVQNHTNNYIRLKDIFQDFRIYAVKHEMVVVVIMNLISDSPESALKPVPADVFKEYNEFCSRIFCLYEPYTDCSNDEGFEYNHMILKPIKNDNDSLNSVRLAYHKFLFEEIESDKLNGTIN